MSRVWLTCWLLALALPVAAGEPVRFRFAPEPELVLERHVETTRLRHLSSGATRSEQVITVARMRFLSQGKGWRVEVQPSQARMLRDGVPVDDPMLAALLKLELRYELDADGRLERVSGYRRLEQLLPELVPVDMRDLVARLVDTDALELADKERWNDRYAGLVGRPAVAGESWASHDSFRLAGGKLLRLEPLTGVLGEEPCGERRCVRVSTRFASASAAIESETRPAETRPADARPSAATAGPARVWGTLVRVIEPDTLLPYSELLHRKLDLPLGSEDGPRLQVEETRETTWTRVEAE